MRSFELDPPPAGAAFLDLRHARHQRDEQTRDLSRVGPDLDVRRRSHAAELFEDVEYAGGKVAPKEPSSSIALELDGDTVRILPQQFGGAGVLDRRTDTGDESNDDVGICHGAAPCMRRSNDVLIPALPTACVCPRQKKAVAHPQACFSNASMVY